MARTAIAGFARLCGFGEEAVADIRLAAGEALSNASEHGGGYSVHCAFDDGILHIEVEDSGRGFSAPPPLATTVQPDGRNRGFGIFLMRQLMDDVAFAGNRVEMMIRRPEPIVTKVNIRRGIRATGRGRRAQSQP